MPKIKKVVGIIVVIIYLLVSGFLYTSLPSWEAVPADFFLLLVVFALAVGFRDKTKEHGVWNYIRGRRR